MNLNLSRLIYLGSEYQPELPGKALLRYIPQVEILEAVIKKGIEGTSAQLDIPLEQLESLYQEGKASGKGNVEEFRTLLSKMMLTEVEIRREQITLSTYLSNIKDISSYMEREGIVIVQHEEEDLGEFSEGNDIIEIPKHNSGFIPIDLLIGGFYQGITTVIGRPGHGKTSLMITLMEEYRKSAQASSLWFFEVEIPKPLMLYRLSPLTNRTKFEKGKDRLICGSVSIGEIEAMVKENPDPDRIILIDSPDTMAAGTGDKKRFTIEDIYIGLIRLKPFVKSIFVTSWPRRNDRNITLESGAEAWAKAWYSDIVIGMAKLGRVGQGYNTVRLNCVKNRFGIADNDITFKYHYGDLSWEIDMASVGGNDDW